MHRPHLSLLCALTCAVAIAACSNDEASPSDGSLTLAPSYHLKSIDGVPLPIAQGADSIDSGRVRRLGGDTLKVDLYSHGPPANGAPRTFVDAVSVWLASQSGSFVVLRPGIATGVDTAFLSGDSLSLHDRSGGTLHASLFIAP